MAKKVLLIGEEAFILTSLKNSIQACGHDVDVCTPTLMTLPEALMSLPEMVIIYGGEFLENRKEVLVYINDFLMEHELKIGVLGYQNEIDIVRQVIPEKYIWKTVLRPFNIKEFVEALNLGLNFIDPDSSKKHVLVVDDSGTMLRTVKSWLSMKYRVSIASSAAMAISILAKSKPDLILLDYEMPVCDGPQFMEMIRGEAVTADIPVIFLTAKNDVSSVEKVLALKPAGYLLKTMSQEEVLQNVDDFFERQIVKSLDN